MTAMKKHGTNTTNEPEAQKIITQSPLNPQLPSPGVPHRNIKSIMWQVLKVVKPYSRRETRRTQYADKRLSPLDKNAYGVLPRAFTVLSPCVSPGGVSDTAND
uniref:PknD protein n=1 Tax=Fopius arisanus TaxID=64838 RepID=A0A0C9QE41_9HYME